MSKLIKRIVEAKKNNVTISDLKITLKNEGDRLDLLARDSLGRQIRTLQQVTKSKDLDTLLEDGSLFLYDENDNLLSGFTPVKSTRLSTARTTTSTSLKGGTTTYVISDGLKVTPGSVLKLDFDNNGLSNQPSRADHTHNSNSITDFEERVDDRVGELLTNNNFISWNYNDIDGTITGITNLEQFTTSNLAEGNNLYFTNERVDDRVSVLLTNNNFVSWAYDDSNGTIVAITNLSQFTTSNLIEGSNLYYTQSRFDSAFSEKSTSNLSEGSNLYFTNERVDDRVSSLIQNGNGISWSYNDLLGTLTGNIGSLTVNEFLSQNISQWTNDSGYITNISSEKFTDLSDTPSSYVGFEGYIVRVNGTPDSLEFVDGSTLFAAPIHTHVSSEITDFQESVDDRVSSLLIAGNAISLTYSDILNSLEIAVNESAISHNNILNIGTNTHAQIDSHIASTSNPHSTSDANLIVTDITTNNVSTLAHGFTPKLSNVSTQFLNGQGNWTTPSGTANAYLSQSFSSQTSVNIIHNFAAYPLVQVLVSGSVYVPFSITHNTINDFTVSFTSSTSGIIIATLGSPQLNNFTVTSSDYNATNEDYIVQVTGIQKTVTLPTAVGIEAKLFIIKNRSNGNIYVTTTGGELIDSQLILTLASNEAVAIYSDGTQYNIF